MEQIRQFFSYISPISDGSWAEIEPLFHRKALPTNSFFVEEHAYAREIAFLESGCVRAFLPTEKGKNTTNSSLLAPA